VAWAWASSCTPGGAFVPGEVRSHIVSPFRVPQAKTDMTAQRHEMQLAALDAEHRKMQRDVAAAGEEAARHRAVRFKEPI
jgi:hypothetical protein